MIGRGLILLTMLSTCVLSLPVTSSQLENEDVKVMKCIVEVLANVLSRPHLMTVSQECLVTLKTDDRLVAILRHHKFLKELQEIAVQGGQERAHLHRDAETSTSMTQTLQTADNDADRSMLEALGGPGERSILSQKKRTGHGDGNEEKSDSIEDEELQRDNEVEEVQVKRERDESLGSHVSESVDEWSQGKAEKREEEEEKESDEKHANSEESSEEGNVSKDKRGEGSDEKRDARKKKTNERKSAEEDEEEKDKRSALFSHKRNSKEVEQEEEEEEEEEVKRGNRESLKPWTKRAKLLSLKKKAVGKEVQLNTQQEAPHHSKEVEEEEEVKKRDSQRSPEEKELQMIAQRAPEESRGLEEEGSASRKSEEPEIESLAAIESELENVAQKLHELRRG